jgi:hypothetical protein
MVRPVLVVVLALSSTTATCSPSRAAVDSDNVRQVLEYGQKLVKFFPADTVSYNDASNNRAPISGKNALIFSPPST